jgi:hypothetical protein
MNLRNSCLVGEHSRDRRNFRRLVGLHRIINQRRRRSSQQPRDSGIKYVIRGYRLCLRGVTVCMADGVLSGVVSLVVSMPIYIFGKVSIITLNPGLIGSTVQPRRRTIALVNAGNGCAKSTASWPSLLRYVLATTHF